MRKLFDAELQQVGEDLITMGKMVEEAVTKAGRALLDVDLDLAQQVITGDEAIDNLQKDLDERLVYLIAQQAPVASDLRTVVSALRMSMTLERMGDLARHVAEVARNRHPDSALHESAVPVFTQMVAAAVQVSGEVAELLENRSVELAAQIQNDDDILDDLNKETHRLILAEDFDGTIQQAMDITLLSRYLERFGDHSTSIARRVVFLVSGGTLDPA